MTEYIKKGEATNTPKTIRLNTEHGHYFIFKRDIFLLLAGEINTATLFEHKDLPTQPTEPTTQ